MCKTCGKVADRTVREINNDKNPCAYCARPRKNAVTLTALGQTLSLNTWASLYPDCINRNNVRQYLSRRRAGVLPYASYTDEQILFGAHLQKHPDPSLRTLDISQVLGERSTQQAEFQRVIDAVFRHIEPYIRDALVKELAPAILAPKSTKIGANLRVAGHDYLIESLGITIGDLLDVDTPIAEVASYLKQEKFSDVSEKSSKLLDFIPRVDTNHLFITDLEAMALLSRYSIY